MAAPANATPAAIVAGDHAQPGPSGVPETKVAIHHHQHKKYLTGNENGQLGAHHDFNHPSNQHASGKHHGHWHLEHHGKHHRIRSAHGHYLTQHPAGHPQAHQIHLATSHHPTGSNWQLIADVEAHKHHLQAPNGQTVTFDANGQPSTVPAPGPQSAVSVVPVAAAQAAAPGTSPVPTQ